MRKRPKRTFILNGVVRMHPRGFGFVIPDNPEDSDQDIFIPKHLTDNAVDGDHVEVAVNLDSKSQKGPEGEILSIRQRSRTHLAGIIESIEKNTALAYVPLLGESRHAVIKLEKNSKIQVGDRCIFKVLKWGMEKEPTVCEVSHKIGHIDDPSCDIEAAIEEYELRGPFPANAIKEAQSFGKSVPKRDLQGRLNLTLSPCFTIDPDTAKDFDDALSIEKTKKGYFLGVHIADVAHYVNQGSALDYEAAERGNSTYFPGACIPMLPEELSNNLCSLRQGVNRLTVSVLMEFDRQGNLQSSEVKRSVIKSQKRFTYDEALKILEGKRKSPYEQSIKDMAKLCLLLKKKRSERGSIDFALPELVIMVDKRGMPIGTKIEPYHITHQLVEEFMLKANEVVATHLEKRGKEQLFRIHEEPEGENLEEFFRMARSLGFHIPAEPTKQDLQKLFEQAKETPFSHQLAVGFIRNLKLAFYSPRNVGHYGLALEHYCHFTSPIRRYSDLITQRLLFDEEEDGLDLDLIGQKCSEKERISFKAEMGVKLLKKLRLLESWMQENPKRRYAALVTKIKPFGLTFEVRDLNLEGFLHISELENDYFIYDEKTPMLFGEKTGKKHLVGEDLTVVPAHIDLVHLETKWELAVSSKLKRPAKKKKT